MHELDYPLHDKDGRINFVTCMCLHTRHLVGKPTARELRLHFADFPRERFKTVLDIFKRHGQIA